MHMHVARCSSAVKRTAIPWYPDCRPRPRDTTGSTGSPLKPQTGSSCLLVKPKQSRRTGSLPFRESSTDPWCRRSTQVCKHSLDRKKLSKSDSEKLTVSLSLCSWGSFQAQALMLAVSLRVCVCVLQVGRTGQWTAIFCPMQRPGPSEYKKRPLPTLI